MHGWRHPILDSHRPAGKSPLRPAWLKKRGRWREADCLVWYDGAQIQKENWLLVSGGQRIAKTCLQGTWPLLPTCLPHGWSYSNFTQSIDLTLSRKNSPVTHLPAAHRSARLSPITWLYHLLHMTACVTYLRQRVADHVIWRGIAGLITVKTKMFLTHGLPLPNARERADERVEIPRF